MLFLLFTARAQSGGGGTTPAPGPRALLTHVQRVVARDRRATQITAVASPRLKTRRP